MSFSGACFDAPQKASAVEMLQWSNFSKDPTSEYWRFEKDSVTHLAYPSHACRVGQFDRSMVEKLTKNAVQVMREFRPDVIISYGATPFEKSLRRLAQEQGTVSVFYLAHPGYKDPRSFDDIDLVVTDSIATHDLYEARLGLESIVIGKFIAQHDVERPTKQLRHVTFVNPSYHKGVTLFFRIAEMMHAMLPAVKFLVVESRNNLASIESETGIPFSQMRNIRRIGLQTDMSEVFARTHVLLMPSVWHESGGRTAIEALSLGLPVVSANHGGLPEHLGDGATRIDVPQPMRDNPKLIPPASVALPWVSVLAQLWTDSDYWGQRSAASFQQWGVHDPSSRIRMMETKLQELTDARR
jgi:glycosyltransferase involved in cell wall biosynthesis